MRAVMGATKRDTWRRGKREHRKTFSFERQEVEDYRLPAIAARIQTGQQNGLSSKGQVEESLSGTRPGLPVSTAMQHHCRHFASEIHYWPLSYRGGFEDGARTKIHTGIRCRARSTAMGSVAHACMHACRMHGSGKLGMGLSAVTRWMPLPGEKSEVGHRI